MTSDALFFNSKRMIISPKLRRKKEKSPCSFRREFTFYFSDNLSLTSHVVIRYTHEIVHNKDAQYNTILRNHFVLRHLED